MGTNGMMKLEKSLIGIGLKLRGGSKQKPNNSIDSSVQSAGMVRVRAVNDISVASLDKEISFGDQIKYVKRAVNLLHASSMESEEVGAEYDDKGQKLPF